jgi:VanZ family protein
LPSLLAWMLAAYTVVLVYATHHPQPQRLIGEGEGVPSDKSLHFFAYAALAVLAAATLWAWRRWTVAGIAAFIPAILVFAALDEATQPFFRRQADVWDWVSDAVGAMVGLAVVAACRLLVVRSGPGGHG